MILTGLLCLIGAISSADEKHSSSGEPGKSDLKSIAQTSLSPVWQGYRSEIATAEINYLSLLFTLKNRQLTCDQFLEELATIPLVADENLTRQLVGKFCPEKLTGNPSDDTATLNAVGDWRTFRQQGNDRRCVSRVFEHVVTDDLHLLTDHPNRGVKAYRRGACPYWYEQMSWFRMIPTEEIIKASTFSEADANTYRLEYYGPASEEDRKHGSWMLMDRADGIPRQWRHISPLTGKTLRMEVFQQMTQYPGNVMVPAVHVKANVVDEHVTHIQMTVIRQAHFNTSFDDKAFILSVPAKWAWFDLQLDQKTGGTWLEPVADVAAFFRGRTNTTGLAHREGREAVRGITGTTGWRPILLILNGTILIVIGIFLWRRSA